jgi:hypothetical protein
MEVAMPVMLVMQMTIDQVVHVVAVRHGRMSTAVAVHVRAVVAAAAMGGRAP